MSDSNELMKKAAEEGGAFLAAQRAHVLEVAQKEADRRANDPAATLPEGVFDTKDEALIYLADARQAGKFPVAIDDGTGNGDFTIEVPSGFNGHGPTVWLTNVQDSDPNPPLHAAMGQG